MSKRGTEQFGAASGARADRDLGSAGDPKLKLLYLFRGGRRFAQFGGYVGLWRQRIKVMEHRHTGCQTFALSGIAGPQTAAYPVVQLHQHLLGAFFDLFEVFAQQFFWQTFVYLYCSLHQAQIFGVGEVVEEGAAQALLGQGKILEAGLRQIAGDKQDSRADAVIARG